MILLDTSCLIWWAGRQPELSVTALARIEAERPGGEILVSAVTGWELAELTARGRLGLRMAPGAWLARVLAVPQVRLLPVDAEIAALAAALPGPAPAGILRRLLAASALQTGCPLATPSRKLHDYKYLETIW